MIWHIFLEIWSKNIEFYKIWINLGRMYFYFYKLLIRSWCYTFSFDLDHLKVLFNESEIKVANVIIDYDRTISEEQMSILFLTKIHPKMRDVHYNKCLQHYFSYFVAVSFIDGGNRSTRKKPPTCRRSLLPHPLQENIIGFVTRIIRRVPLVEQELLTLPEHRGSCYSIFSFICMFCRSLFVLLCFFFWTLCCLLFFDILIMITPLVSSGSS